MLVVPEHPLQLAVNALAFTTNSFTTLSSEDLEGFFFLFAAVATLDDTFNFCLGLILSDLNYSMILMLIQTLCAF